MRIQFCQGPRPGGRRGAAQPTLTPLGWGKCRLRGFANGGAKSPRLRPEALLYDCRWSGLAGLAAAPDPDFGSFSLGVRWCLTPYGAVIDGTPNTWAGLSANPVKVLASVIPAGRLIKAVEKAAQKFKVAKRIASRARALKAFRDTIRTRLDIWENGFEEAIEKKLDRIPGVSGRVASGTADVITDVAEDLGDRFEALLIKELPASQAEKVFKAVFRDLEVPLWTVQTGIEVRDNGTYGVIDQSKTLILKDEWKHGSTS